MISMHKSFNRLSIYLFFADIFLICLGLYTATILRININLGGIYKVEEALLPPLVYGLAVIFWMLSLLTAEAYHPQKVLRAVDEVVRVLLASVQATLLLAGALYLTYRQVSRFQFIYFYLSTTFLILFYRGLIRIYYRARKKSKEDKPQRVLILGAGDLGLRVAEIILQHSRWGADLVGLLDDDPFFIMHSRSPRQ